MGSEMCIRDRICNCYTEVLCFSLFWNVPISKSNIRLGYLYPSQICGLNTNIQVKYVTCILVRVVHDFRYIVPVWSILCAFCVPCPCVRGTMLWCVVVTTPAARGHTRPVHCTMFGHNTCVCVAMPGFGHSYPCSHGPIRPVRPACTPLDHACCHADWVIPPNPGGQ